MTRITTFGCAIVLLLAVTLLSCGGTSDATKSKEKISMSLGEFEAREGVSSDEAAIIRDSFGTLLQQSGRFIVVDREMTAKIIAEQEFQKTENVQGDKAASGKIHSVRMMLSGTIGRLGQDYVFNIKVTNIETTAVDFAISKIYNGDMEDVVEDLLPDLVAEVVRSMDEH